MLHEEHTRAFTVAKMMDLDMLADVRVAVDRAIAEGWSLHRFREELTPYLQKKGWWGVQEMRDPVTGEITVAQLGSPRRLKTIFDTNMATAYAAGKWKQIEATAKSAPYLMYDAVNDNRTRPQHRAWDGLVLRFNDPWWKTHYPPNDWYCRCSVIQLDERQLRRLGKMGPDTAPPIETYEWVNPRTGEVIYVPYGVGPGWGYHPGLARTGQTLQTLAEKLEAVPADFANAALKDVVASPSFMDWLKSPQGAFPVMRVKDEAAAAIGAERSIAVLSAESAIKNQANHPDLTPEDYAVLPLLGETPTLIVKDSENTFVIVRDGGKLYWAVVKAAQGGGRETFITSFRRTNVDDVKNLLKRGTVLYGDWGK
ncbi:MAG: minor capsid protein [Nitrospinae bacterium]|nr:minor capsid protein [Nitrospinota bacterium]